MHALLRPCRILPTLLTQLPIFSSYFAWPMRMGGRCVLQYSYNRPGLMFSQSSNDAENVGTCLICAEDDRVRVHLSPCCCPAFICRVCAGKVTKCPFCNEPIGKVCDSWADVLLHRQQLAEKAERHRKQAVAASGKGRRKNGVQRLLTTTLRTYHNPIAANTSSLSSTSNTSRSSNNISSSSSNNSSGANTASRSGMRFNTSRGASTTEPVTSTVPAIAGSKRPRSSVGSSRYTRSTSALLDSSNGSGDDGSRASDDQSDGSNENKSAPDRCRHGSGPECGSCAADGSHPKHPGSGSMHSSGECNEDSSEVANFQYRSDNNDDDDFEGFDNNRPMRAPRVNARDSNDEEKDSTVQPQPLDSRSNSTRRAATLPKHEGDRCGFGWDLEQRCIDGSIREVVVLSD